MRTFKFSNSAKRTASIIIIGYILFCLLSIKDIKTIYALSDKPALIIPVINLMERPCGKQSSPYIVVYYSKIEVYCSSKSRVRKL